MCGDVAFAQLNEQTDFNLQLEFYHLLTWSRVFLLVGVGLLHAKIVCTRRTQRHCERNGAAQSEELTNIMNIDWLYVCVWCVSVIKTGLEILHTY